MLIRDILIITDLPLLKEFNLIMGWCIIGKQQLYLLLLVLAGLPLIVLYISSNMRSNTRSNTGPNMEPTQRQAKIEHKAIIMRHLTYQRFISHPMETIRHINESGAFAMTSVPRTLVVFIRRGMGFWSICDDLKPCGGWGGGYRQREVKRSFNQWRRSIINRIERGEYEIEPTAQGWAERGVMSVFGVSFRELVRARRDELMGLSVPNEMAG